MDLYIDLHIDECIFNRFMQTSNCKQYIGHSSTLMYILIYTSIYKYKFIYLYLYMNIEYTNINLYIVECPKYCVGLDVY